MSPLHYTREQLAEIWNVHPIMIDVCRMRGMPVASDDTKAGTSTAKGKRWYVVTRRQCAAILGCHADTLSDAMPRGLRAAVIERGGHGVDMTLDIRVAFQWHLKDIGLLEKIQQEDAFVRTTLAAAINYATERGADEPAAAPTPSRRKK